MTDEQKEIEELAREIDKVKVFIQYSSEPESVSIAKYVLNNYSKHVPESSKSSPALEPLDKNNLTDAIKESWDSALKEETEWRFDDPDDWPIWFKKFYFSFYQYMQDELISKYGRPKSVSVEDIENVIYNKRNNYDRTLTCVDECAQAILSLLNATEERGGGSNEIPNNIFIYITTYNSFIIIHRNI